MSSIISQKCRFRQSLILYAQKHGVTKAVRKYDVNRQYIYRWLKRYDGTLDSLKDRSRKPHSHPKQHTEKEIKLIKNMRRRNPEAGLVVFWIKLKLRGYVRAINSLYRILKKLKLEPIKPPNPKYTPQKYEQMKYPGQRVQIDVKVVPTKCIVGEAKGTKLFQYTAIDEYSRFRYVEAFDEQNTYSSAIFLEHAVKALPFKIECVQTDNGTEFTKRFCTDKTTPTLFQKKLKELNIKHKLIKPFTPRHNGKVERSHRKDNERFYATHTFYSLEDLNNQLKIYNRRDYNNFPMKPLGWKSPKTVLYEFLKQGVTYV